MSKTVLVTGGAGYIGSCVLDELCAQGYQAMILDNGLTAPFPTPGEIGGNMAWRVIRGDIAVPETYRSVLSECVAVLHLAAIVGDPACQLDEHLVWRTNYLGTIRLVETCQQVGISRLVFASTCSLYGQAGDGQPVNEWAPLKPLSLYAQSKLQAEHSLLIRASAAFKPCILRFGTLYGLSPRMRFDLAVNAMTAQACLQQTVQVHGGAQQRPFLHVREAARLLVQAIKPTQQEPEIYNCATEQVSLHTLGQLIVQEVPEVQLIVHPEHVDRRSYQVDCARSHQVFAYSHELSLLQGIREMCEAHRARRYVDISAPGYHNDQLVQAFLQTHCLGGEREEV